MSKFEKRQTILDTEYGEFEFSGYFFDDCDDKNILALVKRPILNPSLVRMQSVCYSGEIFKSYDCDCHAQLTRSLSRIATVGGVFLYLLSDGRGAGLKAKLNALAQWREKGIDTADAYEMMGIQVDPRHYHRAAIALKDIGVQAVRLLTNNPRKIFGLESAGIEVLREPLEIVVKEDSQAYEYLKTKASKLGHLLDQFSVEKKN